MRRSWSPTTRISSRRDVCRRLSSDVGSRRSVDPLHRRPYRRPARSALADLGRASAPVMRRIRRPPISSAATTRPSRTAGMSSASSALARQKAMGTRAAGDQMPARNDGVKAWDEHSRRREARVHAAAVGLRRHARSCRPASGAADRVSGNGRRARQHADHRDVGQWREPGRRAARLRQCDGAV